MSKTNERSGMNGRPSNLSGSILWNLAMMPVTEDADAETKSAHRALRAQFQMNPDIRLRGDAA